MIDRHKLTEASQARLDAAISHAVRSAAERAYREKGESFVVYVSDDSTAVYMRDANAAPPKDSTKHCVAQFWSDRTVQVRYAGAHSEWRTF